MSFDGDQWVHYTAANSSLPSDMAPWIAAAPNGTIWVGTEAFVGSEVRNAIAPAGVAVFDGSTWTRFTTLDGLPADNARVAVGDDGTVWALADEGIARFDGSDWIVSTPYGSGFGATVGPDGSLWQPVPSGISGFDGTERTSLMVSPAVAPHGVPALSLVPAAEPVTTVTPIGEITWHRFAVPTGHGLDDITSTPFGLVALDGDVLRWSQDLVHWSGSPLSLDPRNLTIDGRRIIAHLPSALWLRWDQGGWVPDEILELGGTIDQIMVGDAGTVTTGSGLMFHSEDGRLYTSVDEGPTPPQVEESPIWAADGLVGCVYGSVSWSPNIDVGPVLATAEGFVALTPAHPANWDKQPLCEPVIWWSDDGASWAQVSTETPFGARSVVVGVASHAGRHVAVGSTLGVDSIWVSDDGLAWTAVDPPDGPVDPTAVAGSEAGWMLLEDGGRGWVSVDGFTWAPIPEGMPATRTFWSPQTISMGNGLIAISGTEELVLGVFSD
jgi:hypothetical protein